MELEIGLAGLSMEDVQRLVRDPSPATRAGTAAKLASAFNNTAFSPTELQLAAGSVLALFTDGLIESRNRDIDHGLAELIRTLGASVTSLEDTCDTVIDTLLGRDCRS